VETRQPTLSSIDAGQVEPWIRIQISTAVLIRGNAATFPDIQCDDAVNTLAPQPLLSSTMRIKFDYTIDYHIRNPTETRFLVVVNTTSIPYIPRNL
jgi:hypothetical protein